VNGTESTAVNGTAGPARTAVSRGPGTVPGSGVPGGAAGGSAVPGGTVSDADLDLLLLIRRFEERLLQLFAEGLISGTTHTCLGQEYVPVAMAPLLQGDYILSNHRGHGHYLAHGGDVSELLAELAGREGAPCNGVGGSQHLRGPGFLSTGVQGESVAVAAGIALHFRHTAAPRVAAVYIGDGTWGEGGVYEGLNIASLWELPLLVIVEHNQIAQSTPTARQMAGTVAARAAAFGITCDEFRTDDLAEIRARLAPAVGRVRSRRQPHVVVFHTRRLGPHSKGDDTRAPDELADLLAADWLARFTAGIPQRARAADARAIAAVDAAVRDVLARPLSSWRPR
jgi:acetoin:2,6-dichlorophenolindophenol oxidoreductase subunit alpha